MAMWIDLGPLSSVCYKLWEKTPLTHENPRKTRVSGVFGTLTLYQLGRNNTQECTPGGVKTPVVSNGNCLSFSAAGVSR